MSLPKRQVLARSAVAASLVSITFPLAEMAGYAFVDGLDDTLKPVRQLAAVALGERALDDEPSVVAVLLVGGVVVNFAFNLLFCLPFVALAAAMAPLGSSRARLIAGAVLYGAALWPLNFYVFAPVIGWDFFPDLHDPIVEAVAHVAFFGLPVGLYLANGEERCGQRTRPSAAYDPATTSRLDR